MSGSMSCQFWQGAAKTATVETIRGGLADGFDKEDFSLSGI